MRPFLRSSAWSFTSSSTLAGCGLYQERGRSARRIVKGDVVRIAPDVEHWHGACPDSWMTHVSIETNGTINKAEWLDPVTNEEYAKAAE